MLGLIAKSRCFFQKHWGSTAASTLHTREITRGLRTVVRVYDDLIVQIACLYLDKAARMEGPVYQIAKWLASLRRKANKSQPLREPVQMGSYTAAPLAYLSANHASRLDAVVPEVAGKYASQQHRTLQVGINTVPVRTRHNFPQTGIKPTHHVYSSSPFSSWKSRQLPHLSFLTWADAATNSVEFNHYGDPKAAEDENRLHLGHSQLRRQTPARRYLDPCWGSHQQGKQVRGKLLQRL